MKYIEQKFLYYGYNINDKKTYKINFEQKLNTYFSLENELLSNSNDYYELFYELFKYLWNLEIKIDVEKYDNNGLYSQMRYYFEDFIKMLGKEGLIS